MPFRSRLGVPAAIIFGLLAGGFSCALAAEPPSADQRAFVDIYRELIEINTTDSTGDTLRAAEAMAARLRAGGIPAVDIKVLSSGPRKGNLVARLRGTGARRPLLLLAHLDVVEAKREDWDFDPFKLQEADGYFRARGAIDDKAMAAIFVANMIALCQERATGPSATSSSRSRPTRSFRIRLTTACAGCCSITAT